MDAEELLSFWFGPPGGPVGAAKRWSEKDPQFDAFLRDRCLDLHREIVAGDHEDWRQIPRPCLAYVVVLDQLSRNMFREHREAFAYDIRTQAAVLEGMRAGFDRTLEPHEQLFFYMPLVHAEDRQLQDQAVLAFATLAESTPEESRAPIANQLLWAVKHRNVILRFGRFPHRNAILGRESTPDEVAFLKEPGSSF
jgi:uncharacterized protein (DUF924 family)